MGCSSFHSGLVFVIEKVAQAAVIAIPDEKWDERPLAVIVLAPGVDSATQEG